MCTLTSNLRKSESVLPGIKSVWTLTAIGQDALDKTCDPSSIETELLPLIGLPLCRLPTKINLVSDCCLTPHELFFLSYIME